ncbi:MAG: hypothetical protein AB1733_19095 [Thermodesulfobacteriota bacterium]
MPTAPVIEPTDIDPETQEMLADPEVQAAWEALDDPEDREDLIDHVKVMRRLREGKEKTTPWEEVKARLGL